MGASNAACSSVAVAEQRPDRYCALPSVGVMDKCSVTNSSTGGRARVTEYGS